MCGEVAPASPFVAEPNVRLSVVNWDPVCWYRQSVASAWLAGATKSAVAHHLLSVLLRVAALVVDRVLAQVVERSTAGPPPVAIAGSVPLPPRFVREPSAMRRSATGATKAKPPSAASHSLASRRSSRVWSRGGCSACGGVVAPRGGLQGVDAKIVTTR